MRDKIIIFSVAGFIIFFLGFIAHLQYFQTKENVIKLYSEKQTTLALQAATSLEAYIKERIKTLELLTNMPASIYSNHQLCRNELKRIYDVVDGFVVFGDIIVIRIVIPQAGDNLSVAVIEIAAFGLEAFGIDSYAETSRSGLQHMQDYITVVIDEGGAW